MSSEPTKSRKASEIFNKKNVAFNKQTLSQTTKHKKKTQILRASDINKNAQSASTSVDQQMVNKQKAKQTRAIKGRFQTTIQFDKVAHEQKKAQIAASAQRGNTFKDHRNLNATEAEVKLALYKQKQGKLNAKAKGQSRFALGDEDAGYEDNEALTHGGKALADMTIEELRVYNNQAKEEEEDEYYNGKISKEETMTHFGGGVLQGEQMKLTRLPRAEFLALSLPDRRRLMVENSKLMKALKKGQKAHAEELLKEIDLDFNDIRGLLDFRLPGEDDDDDAAYQERLFENEHEHYKLHYKMKNGLLVKKPQSEGEYMDEMLAKYGISKDGADDSEEEEEEDQEEGDDEDDYDDEDDFDDEDGEEEEEDGDESDSPKTAAKGTQSIETKFQQALRQMQREENGDAEDQGADFDFNYKDDQEWTDALTKLSDSRVARIGLDGKAINSSETKLGSTNIAIGSNVSNDDYMAQTLSLQNYARAKAGSRVVTDAEKAARHRSYLLYLEQKRLERKSGDYNPDEHNDDALEKEYEQIFLKQRKSRAQERQEDNELVVKAMLDGDDDDDMIDTGLIKNDKIVAAGASDDEEEQDEDMEFDEDDDEDMEFDEDDDEDMEFDEDDEDADVQPRATTKSKASSGDSLDDGFDLDDDVHGVGEDWDMDEVQIVEAGGEATYLNTDKQQKKRQPGEESAMSRKQRKEDLGMLINDVDTALKDYYLCSDNTTYKQFVARCKVIFRDEIPYSYDFPETFNAFIGMVYKHIVAVTAAYNKYYEENDIELLFATDNTIVHKLTEAKAKGITLQLILGRIFQLYHPRISGPNEAKTENLYKYLWRLLKISTQQYQEYTLEQDENNNNNKMSDTTTQPTKTKAYISKSIYDVLAISDVITSFVFQINELLPRFTGKACIGLVEMFSQSLEPPAIGSIYPATDRQTTIQSKQFGTKVVTMLPDLHELFAYKLLMQCYPLSDYRHTIMTPLQLVLCQTLTTCQVLTNIDLVKVLFILGCLLEIWRASDRVIPECFPAVQSVMALINNTYYYHDVKENAQTNNTTTTTQTKPIAAAKGKKATPAAAAQQQQQTPPVPSYKYIKPLLESYREHGNTAANSTTGINTNNIISPTTLPTLLSLEKQLLHFNQRSTGVLPLAWLSTSETTQQQINTEYFRYTILTTLCSFITTLTLYTKTLISCNEVLEPIAKTLNILLHNVRTYIEKELTPKPDAVVEESKPATTTNKKQQQKGKKQQQQKDDQQKVSLLTPNDNTIYLTKYNTLLTSLTSALTHVQEVQRASTAGRKPLYQFAKVLAPVELEPKLEIDETYKSKVARNANDYQYNIKQRREMEKKLKQQKINLRKDVRRRVQGEQLERQKAQQEREQQRKQQLTRARALVQSDLSKESSRLDRNFKKPKH